jgi:hypothetical protein
VVTRPKLCSIPVLFLASSSLSLVNGSHLIPNLRVNGGGGIGTQGAGAGVRWREQAEAWAGRGAEGGASAGACGN